MTAASSTEIPVRTKVAQLVLGLALIAIWELAATWLAMLISFDAVFITLSLWTFGPVMSE